MITASKQFAAFIKSQIQTPAVYIKVQLPNSLGTTVTQFLLTGVETCSLKRSQDRTTDTCGFTHTDDFGNLSALNTNSKYGVAFAPGVIDCHFLVYFGFRGNLTQ